MVDIYSVKNKLESAECQNTSLKEMLDKKAQDQEDILNNLWWYIDNIINLGNLGKLAENSKELIQLMRN
jgi:hypothetical protein